VIPTLNEEKYICKILESLQNQQSKNFEVIIVDANSKDKTKEIALAYGKKIPLTFHQLEKGNLSYQKNLGSKLAKGEYVLFLDADMLIGKFFTKIAEKELKKINGFVFVPYVFPIEKKEYPDVNAIIGFMNKLVGLSYSTNKPFSAGPAQIWEKNAFLKIGGFDEVFGEDHMIIRKAYSWGIIAKQIPALKVKFSLRRMKKEGRMKLFGHFIKANFHFLFNDTLGKDFEYEMGGQLYDIQSENKKLVLNDDLVRIVQKTKKFIKFILE
jgi:glycosyltransferase involved in cell wall biosynthesis